MKTELLLVLLMLGLGVGLSSGCPGPGDGDDDDTGDDDGGDDDSAHDDDDIGDDDSADDDDIPGDDDVVGDDDADDCDDDDSAGDDDDSSGDDDDSSGDDDDSAHGPPDCLTTMTAQGIGLVKLCVSEFEMGCTSGQSSCSGNESPSHLVTLTRDFWMTATEVTQAQWALLVGINPSNFSPGGGGPDCGGTCPVEKLNWWEALTFANRLSAAEGLSECYELTGCNSNELGEDLECAIAEINSATGSVYGCEGYRLPTEAEWEYAARAGEELLYSGSDSISDVGWYSKNSGLSTHPVAGKQPNAFGLYDMSGNVWDWIWDRWSETHYTSCAQIDPTGPSEGLRRVVRGGSWSDGAVNARVSNRYHHNPGHVHDNVGLRLVRTAH